MNKRIIAVCVMTILFLGTNAVSKVTSEEEMSLANAKNWLAIIDNGEYAKSWDGASNIFKNALTSDMWEESLSAIRKPLGQLISRKMLKQQYHSSLPGVPPGSYFVIQFSTKFENKENVVETITMAKEKDGTWKSAGYFIK